MKIIKDGFDFIWIVILVFFIFFFVDLIHDIHNLPKKHENDLLSEINEIYANDNLSIPNNSISEGCENLSLFKTAKCLNRNVRSFYSYNISNNRRALSFEDLKREGGVCFHWSRLYYNSGKELGFEAEEVYSDGHVWAVLQNETAECTLDQRFINCSYIKSITNF